MNKDSQPQMNKHKGLQPEDLSGRKNKKKGLI